MAVTYEYAPNTFKIEIFDTGVSTGTNGTGWVVNKTDVAYIHYTKTKNGQTIELPVRYDGTVAVDKDALIELLTKAGVI